jgi:hypothetical protein
MPKNRLDGLSNYCLEEEKNKKYLKWKHRRAISKSKAINIYVLLFTIIFMLHL